MLTVENVLKILEEVAPLKISDDFCKKFKMYDNSGVIINCGREVDGALFSLDLSEAAVNEAIKRGYNLIVTHHPAIYGGIDRFDLPCDAHARALAACLKNDISVISMHLNMDAAPDGIDSFLMKGLGGTECRILATVEGGGYGRVYGVQPVDFNLFVKNLSKEFSTEPLLHGKDERTVKKVASFCGAGGDDDAVAFAKQNGADVVVSSDLSHHRIVELVESGIAVVQITHYAAESYGFGKIYDKIKNKLNVPLSFFFDERFA